MLRKLKGCGNKIIVKLKSKSQSLVPNSPRVLTRCHQQVINNLTFIFQIPDLEYYWIIAFESKFGIW